MLLLAKIEVRMLLCVCPDTVMDSLLVPIELLITNDLTAVGVQGDDRVYGYIAM
jgi:hypothetical protein